MKRGAWHQSGDRSQKLALEQLQNGSGTGVVISPRDLSRDLAVQYASQYRDAGADVLIDQQFYIPDSTVGRLVSYETAEFRQAVSSLHQLSNSQFTRLGTALRNINTDIGVSAVIAPGVVCEAGRPDIARLNSKLFRIAKEVGNDLGVPTYATLVLGRSVTSSDNTIGSVLSDATSLNADGWYFAFEFDEARIPASYDSILRFCDACFTLARTGKPVFHAYAGPLSLFSPCLGVTAVGIGHSQNLWQFSRGRWQSLGLGGGGGQAPPRFFSTSLWGTIVYEDEFALLSRELREIVLTPTPFSTVVSARPPYLPWDRWDANKHLVYSLAKHAEEALQELDVERASNAALELLARAIALHARITGEGISLADNTNSYQGPWREALMAFVAGNTNNFELMQLLRQE